MTKETFEIIKREIIEAILPIDEHSAEIDNLMLSAEVNQLLDITVGKKEIEKIQKKNDRLKNALIKKVLSKYKKEIQDSDFYVCLSGIDSDVLRFYDILSGHILTTDNYKDEYNFVRSNLIIYPEDTIGIIPGEMDLPVIARYYIFAEEVRGRYYNEAVKDDIESAKIRILSMYNKKDR